MAPAAAEVVWCAGWAIQMTTFSPASARCTAESLDGGAAEVAGFFRLRRRDATDSTDVRNLPPLVGRSDVISRVTGMLASPGTVVAVHGGTGIGKSRLVREVAERLRSVREVISVRARARLLGDRADDDRVSAALGGPDLATALAAAGRRGAVLLVDDAHQLSSLAHAELVRPDLPIACLLTSPTPLVPPGRDPDRTHSFELPTLDLASSDRLLRELLKPALLLPDALVERLAIRGTGVPGTLVALAFDIKRRGSVRRHPGSDEWYVAANELDTLLESPGANWCALRALDNLTNELVPVIRAAAMLGPRFAMAELHATLPMPHLEQRVELLVTDGLLLEHGGWFEIADPALAAALFELPLDTRAETHRKAYAFWLAHRDIDDIAWLARIAFHAAGAGNVSTASAAWLALASAARRRGEVAYGRELSDRATAALLARSDAPVAHAIASLFTE